MTRRYTHVRYYQECPLCGYKAWEYTIKPYPEMKLSKTNIIHNDEVKCKRGGPVPCQHCKTELPEIYQGHKIFIKFLLVEKS